MIEALSRWRITCDSRKVTKTVDVLVSSAPRTPEGWQVAAGERGPSGYPKRVHYCEVCASRMGFEKR